ncbi:MAG: flagellar hook-basal body complex protein [Candidatus Omnitrophica bacterium]|nr:flagellar hook-basal body complex protein [Candidatus Omnitrophota bacterium]MCB9783578.1 flagellar hook-basal body complex protein [Candidatus Omnitrophota bacterium]
MIQGLSSLLSGLQSNLRFLGNTANNLANLNTDGFRERGTNLSTGPGGLGVRVASTPLNTLGGAIRTTGGSLDVAIEGDSFFQVDTPNGPRYTRSGSFQLDGEGFLVTSEGYRLAPGIQVPTEATEVSIGRDGTVSGTVGGEQVVFGQIQSTRFNNPGGLESVGGNLFAATADSGDPIQGTFSDPGFGQLSPGSVETSNVDLTGGIVDTILAQRFIEAQISAIRTTDEVLQESVNLTRPRS